MATKNNLFIDEPKKAIKLVKKKSKHKKHLTMSKRYAILKRSLNKVRKLAMSNKKKVEKEVVKSRKSRKLSLTGVMGLLMLFVVASIAYSSYVVYFGTVGIIPKALLAPQMLFAAIVLTQKFSK